ACRGAGARGAAAPAVRAAAGVGDGRAALVRGLGWVGWASLAPPRPPRPAVCGCCCVGAAERPRREAQAPGEERRPREVQAPGEARAPRELQGRGRRAPPALL